MALNSRTVRFDRFGAPSSVLSVTTESVSEDVKPNQVIVKMLAAPISPIDFSQIKGFGSSRRTGVAGNEGVGKVVSTGSAVTDLKVNDLVVPAQAGVGTWRDYVVAESTTFARVEGADVAPEVAATAVVAPGTARRLLTDFADLKEGDVIIQNNAGSTVGQAVMQLAAARGIKTINILRHRGDWNDIVNHFHGLGATIVVNEEFARTHEFAKLIADLPAPKLGLNSVGGKSTATVAGALGEGATLVSFGGSESSAVTVPLASLVEKDITVKGFNFQRWLETAPAAARDELIAQAFDDARKGAAQVLVASEPFADFEIALKRASQAGERKVVLVM